MFEKVMTQTLDYLRIVGVSEVCFASPDVFSATFSIVYSHDADFKNPLRGMITLNLTDFIDDTSGMSRRDAERIVSRLTGQVLVRSKEEDGVVISSLFGMNLSDWLRRKISL